MVNKIQGIDYETALVNLRASSLELRGDLPLKKVRGGVGHVHDLQREMTRAGLTGDIKAPVLYPDYGKFDLREHAGLQEQ